MGIEPRLRWPNEWVTSPRPAEHIYQAGISKGRAIQFMVGAALAFVAIFVVVSLPAVFDLLA